MRLFLFILILLSMLMFQCSSNKELQVQEYLDLNMLPMPATYSATDSVFLRDHWTTGYYQYKSNCSGCHGIFGKGKENIPNFTKVQFDNYGASFLAGDKKNHAVMKNVTEDELFSIFLFLQSLRREE